MSKLTVYSASAGSGKTFTLSAEYISKLISGDPDAANHILAVTFTNKATAEMKTRILQHLYDIGYINDPADKDRQSFFDKVKDQTLIFAASVGRPQTDEYIPLILSLSKTGHLTVKQDTQMDTVPNDEEENN